jgi:hypothetical protein
VGMTLAMTSTAGATVQNPRHPHYSEDLHGHVKVIGLEESDGLLRYRKCVDLPVTPMHAQHKHKHMGGAHGPDQIVGPTAPYGFIQDCAHLAVVIGPPGVWFADPDA